LDLGGNPRVQGSKIDIGAYEASVGTVVAWGGGDMGGANLGQTNVPPGLHDVVLIGAGERSSVAMLRDGSTVAWGEVPGYSGNAAVPLEGFNNLVAIEGMNSLVGLRRDGVGVSQLTDAERLAVLQPVGKKVVSVDTGGNGHVLALYSDGSLGWAGPSDQSLTKPPTALIPGLVDAQIAGQFGLGLRSDGTLVAWQNGQIVNIQAYNDQAWYTAMPLKPPFSAISGGGGYMGGISDQGNFWAWGNGGMGYAGKEKLVEISAGLHVMYGLSESGRVYALREPIAPPAGLTNVVQVAAGGRHGLAIVSAIPAPRITAERSLKALVGDTFRYQIPATGTVDEYSVIGLPEGLSLDAKAGVISGKVAAAGDYRWRLTAIGPGGLDGRVVAVEFIPSYPVNLEVVNGSTRGGLAGFVFRAPTNGYGFAYQFTPIKAGVYTSEVTVDSPFNMPGSLWAASSFPELKGWGPLISGNQEYISRHVKTDLGNGTEKYTTRIRVSVNEDSGLYQLAMFMYPQVTVRRITLTREEDGVQILKDPDLGGVPVWIDGHPEGGADAGL
jgi:hypothetical protein